MTERPWDPGTLSPLKRAYLALEQMQAKLEAREQSRPEPIAIIGIGCRFPGGADTPLSFWRLLREAVDAIGDVPATRWSFAAVTHANVHADGTNVPASGGFLREVEGFDPEFFGISPREAFSLDPQQRLLLEVAWEALERAGQVQDRLAANDTGVFVGITSHDYAQLQGASGRTAEFDAYHITGNALNAAAGRLSYVFGFRGPCIAVDTACSSSLVAVHLACRSLASGECSLALAGGVNLILSPIASIALARARVLSPDGRCKAFDAAADGMGRGEGCGVVVLKRLSDALRDRDPIVAVVAGSAINQDGPSSGLTVPNGVAQEALIRRALANARMSPADVDYIEAHGTGTSLGDPVEFGALAAVFGPGRSPDRPLHVGSVKSNIGHSEAAAGIAGLIKAALSLSHAQIPAHLHFSRPSAHIRWSDIPVTVPTALAKWPEKRGRKAAGVSSFGFTGTNAHVVLQEAPDAGSESRAAMPARPVQLLVLSARSSALMELARQYEEHLSAPAPVLLEDVCYTASTRRRHFEHRLAIRACSAAELAAALRAFRDGLAGSATTRRSDAIPRVAWAFADDRGQSLAIGRETAEAEPVFRQSVERCNNILGACLGQVPLDILSANGAAASDPVHRQVALFTLQYGFAQVWRSWGLLPAALIGDGVGEYVAAAVAEVMSLDDALKLLVSRIRLQMRHRMHTAGMAREPWQGDQLPTPEVVDAFRSSATAVRYSAPKIKLRNLTGASVPPPTTMAEHWVSEFCSGLRSDHRASDWPVSEYDLVLDIGPASPPSPVSDTWLSGVPGDRSECTYLMDVLSEFYVRGADVDWRAFWRDRPGRHVVLPTYPFERQRYWISTEPEMRRQPLSVASPEPTHPLLGERLRLAGTSDLRFESRVRADSTGFLQDHRVFGETVFPAAAYLELALSAAATAAPSGPMELREISFERPLLLSPDTDTTIQLALIDDGTYERRFQVFSRTTTAHDDDWSLHCSGLLARSAGQPHEPPVLDSLQRTMDGRLAPADFYEQCRVRGIDLGPRFQPLTRIVRTPGSALGLVELPLDLLPDAPRFQFHPVLLDGCLQVLGAAGLESGRDNVYLPLALDRLHMLQRPAGCLWSYARIRAVHAPDPMNLTVDFWLFSEEGQLVATLDGLQLRRASPTLSRRADRVEDDWLYEILWPSHPQDQELQQLDRVALMRGVCAEAPRTRPDPLSHAEQSAYERLMREMDDLSSQYAVLALRQLGYSFSPGQSFTSGALAGQLQIPARYHKLLNRFLEMFVDDGWLAWHSPAWQVRTRPELFDPVERVHLLEREFPDAQNELHMLGRCGSRLGDVLAGHCEPLELLFPEDEPVTAASLYQDSPGALAANAVIEGVFATYLRLLPEGRRLRVMEIGGGTGGTTVCLLPHLATAQVHYVFTDISAAFLNRARQRFSECGFIDYRTFDVETAPSEQGFSDGTFDIVLAANVLHATRDLPESLRHIRQVLAPGGMLVLLEGVAPLRFIDLIFGMTEGWWRFSDGIRTNHPLVSASEWRELLARGGFADTTIITPEERAGFFASQAVILATAGNGATREDPADHWVVFADQQGIAERVATELSSAGALCTLVTRAEAYDARSEGTFSIDPHKPDHFRRLFDDLHRTARGPLKGIVHLWALDATTTGDTCGPDAAAELTCGSVLYLVQAVTRVVSERTPALVLVTRGAQPVGDDRPASGLFQAPLWGMAKALALEHPELRCRRLDLDSGDLDPSSGARSILNELSLASPEDQVAYRGQGRYVARLARHRHSTSESRRADIRHTHRDTSTTRDESSVRGWSDSLRPQFRDDATYLITGGLSGLGIRVAHWMAGRGARHLALMARSEINDTRASELRALRDRGVTATFYRGDVSDVEQVRRMLEQMSVSSPPLRGIIHSAGVLADGGLLHQSWDRFERVLKPKVNGAWNLHLATLDQPLDFFVLFSSAASLLGSPAQANHSAANAFLDALAAHRQALGLPALSINWGAWSTIGSGAGEELSARLAMHGIDAMSPEQGLHVLADLMASGATQVGVIPIQWASVLREYPAGTEPPFYSLIAAAERERASRESARVAAGPLHVPRGSSMAERSTWLQEYLTDRVAGALQLAKAQISPAKPLNRMGLDSLMAIEIRNRLKRDLGLDVPAVRFLDGVTIAALADELARMKNGSTTPAPQDGVRGGSTPPITPQEASHLLSRVGDLTDDQVDALLAAVAAHPPDVADTRTADGVANEQTG